MQPSYREENMTDVGSAFRALHEADGIFIIPNPWDIGTARLMAAMGFKALATTSAGFAFTRGRPDGDIPFDQMVQHCREIVSATPLPVSGDLGCGKGQSPESAAETIFAADAAGLAGCSIEDATGDPNHPIFDFSLAVERVAAAAEAAKALKRDFVFTARAENLLFGRDLDDAIRRLQAFEEAEADVLYAPGLRRIEDIRMVCQSVRRPVNVLALDENFSVEALAEAGVKRISLGSRLAVLTYGALEKAMQEMLLQGSFGFNRYAMPSERIVESFAAGSRSSSHETSQT